jgi:hypothetical protein
MLTPRETAIQKSCSPMTCTHGENGKGISEIPRIRFLECNVRTFKNPNVHASAKKACVQAANRVVRAITLFLYWFSSLQISLTASLFSSISPYIVIFACICLTLTWGLGILSLRHPWMNPTHIVDL